jgi:hypothetical protein
LFKAVLRCPEPDKVLALAASAPQLVQALQLIEVDLTAGDMPAKTRVALALSRVQASLSQTLSTDTDKQKGT